MRSHHVIGVLAALAAASAAHAQASQLTVTIDPRPAYIETRDDQSLNFEFHVDNPTASPARLERIEVERFDRDGRLINRRDLDGSGASPAAELLAPDRTVPARSQGLVYNPFFSFPKDADLSELRFSLTFSQGGEAPPVVRQVTLRPKPWRPATPLVSPIGGRVWVLHGHDFYAHHRRWNPLHPIARGFGATAIFARYGLDLQVVDAQGRPRRGKAKTNGDFYGWGAELRAPGSGIVVAAHDAEPDDDIATGKSSFDPERLPREPLHFYGNYLVIDHGDGEFSLLGHLKQASLKVKLGDRVRQGQPVAELGASGSAEFEPHLHYELRTGPTMAAEGLPAYFRNWRLLEGSRSRTVAVGPMNSGDFAEAD